MSTAAGAPGISARSPEERAREVALGEVSDVLLNIEHSLVAAIAEIEKTRKRLMQDTYYAGDALRLL